MVPIAFFLMLLGSYGVRLPVLKPLRVISYYSYNWYLWHMLTSYFVADHVPGPFLRPIVFMATGFILAFIFTHAVEEPVLARRKRWMGTMLGGPRPLAAAVEALNVQSL